jgi:DnaJ-class molecular chaperone
MKSYYEILGVDRTASIDEIKKAYRKLAKSHHPDKSGGSSEKFSLITEAYDVLSNSEKRSQHDNNLSGFRLANFFGNIYGQSYDSTMGFNRFHRRASKISPDARAGISIDMGKAYIGFTATVRFDRNIECKKCNGNGREESGNVCAFCRGNGRTQETADVKVKVPPKTLFTTLIVVPESGNFMADGRKGNLEVFIQYVQKHEGVVCSADGTLYKDVVVPWDSALLEEKHEFKVFSCCTESILMNLKSSIPNGGSYRFNGMGMSNKDLIVKVWYSLPSNINEQHRQLIAKSIRDAKS